MLRSKFGIGTLSQRYMVPNCLKWINIEFLVNLKPVLGSLPLDFVHEGNKWQKVAFYSKIRH